MATIITVPHLIMDGGISPKRLRTFSERNSISSDDFFFFRAYHIYRIIRFKKSISQNNYVPNSS